MLPTRGDTVTLPDPDTATLSKAPLESVVFQVRHEGTEVALSPDVGVRLIEELGRDYPNLEEVTQGELFLQLLIEGSVTRESDVSSSKRLGWKLKSDDDKWVVQVLADSASIECTGYTTWAVFAERVRGLVEAVETVVQPRLLQRVGLRYVDRIILEGVGSPLDWMQQKLLAPYLLTFVNDPSLSESVIASQTNSHLDLGDAHVILRSSCAPDNRSHTGYSTVLDTDCFDPQSQKYESSGIVQTSERLHLRALQLFQVSTTTELRARLNS